MEIEDDEGGNLFGSTEFCKEELLEQVDELDSL